jgi:competence protein ComEC
MIVGDDSMLMRNVREEFQQTGVYHLLVVSGMNVALLAFAIFWLARRLRLPEWPASLLTIGLSVFYAYIAGMGVPIMRAVFILSLFLVARLLHRDRSGLNATGFAALVVLVLSPMSLFDAAFQLTFLALLGITGISVPLLERTSSPYRQALTHLDSTGYDLSLDPKVAQFRLDLRLVAGRLAQFFGARLARVLVTSAASVVLALYELALVSLVTQAAVVLPMRAYFHRAAILGVAANTLILPLAGLMLNAGVVAIALSYVSLPFAHLAARIAALALHWTLACVDWREFPRLPMARVRSCSAVGTSRGSWNPSGHDRSAPETCDGTGGRGGVFCVQRHCRRLPRRAENSKRKTRDHGYRRWPGGFHSCDFASGEDHADRWRREH